MRSTRTLVVLAVLVVLAAVVWYAVSNGGHRVGNSLTVYYTKLDGNTLGSEAVSMRPRAPGESAAEHVRNAVLYAAVQAVAGPPSDVSAIRFPPGTRVVGATVDGATARVDLSNDVERQAGGTFGENGEFKALVYTVTSVPGISALQVTVGGQTLPSLPGGHLELDQPLHRSDF